MSVSRYVVRKTDNFDKPFTPTTTPAGEFGWTIKDTSAAGTPTYTTTSEDVFNITLDNTSEVQNVCLFQNDVLPFKIDNLQYVEFILAIPVAATGNTTLFFGVSNARNDAVASITQKAIFKVAGATSTTAIVIDTKDGTTAISNVATGKTIGSTYMKYTIDFTNGLKDVRFYIDGARVAASQKFDLSALTTDDLQLILQLYKASSTDVPQVNLKRVDVQYKIAAGA